MGGGGGRGSPPSPPRLVAPREIPLEETFAKFLGQRSQLPSLTQFATDLNQLFREERERGLPGTLAAAGQVSTLVNQLLGGEIPADVSAQVSRRTAERAQALGLPYTSPMAGALQARDFGYTTMGLMQQGAEMVPGMMQLSAFLSPQDATNYLFSTGGLRAEGLKQAQDEAAVANANAMNQYNYEVAKYNARGSGGLLGGLFGGGGRGGGFLGTIGGLAGGVLGSVFPGVGTALGGALGSAIGNFAGGGSFSPTAGGSVFSGLLGAGGGGGGGLFGNLLGLGGGGGGMMGGGSTAFGNLGQAFTMPSDTFFNPYAQNAFYPNNNFMVPQNLGNYNGMYPLTVGGIKF